MPGLTHLQRLEAESIHIFREAVAESERPVMLYSLGKDSSVMLRLAQKAFFPSPLPFPLLHVDTTWKFREMYEFRDDVPAMDLLTGHPSVRLAIDAGAPFEDIVAKAAASGVKVVMATHDIGQARRLAGDVVFLLGGRIIERTAAPEFFRAPKSAEARRFLAGELVF